MRATHQIVIARFMRAIQFLVGGQKMDCPDKPGNDIQIGKSKSAPTGWPAFAGHDNGA